MSNEEKYALIGKLVSDLKKTAEERTLCGEAITQAGETLERLGRSLAEFTCKELSNDDRQALDAQRIEALLANYARLSRELDALRRRKAELGF